MQCEHQIGEWIDYDNVHLITFKELSELYKTSCYPLNKYLDRRYSVNLIRFNYCPICGEKIDWDKMKKQYDDI